MVYLMAESRTNVFEVVLLVVGIGAAVLGFMLINQVYKSDNQLSWMMIIAIFNWLSLLVMFILLSLMVDTSKKEVNEIRNLIDIVSKKKR